MAFRHAAGQGIVAADPAARAVAESRLVGAAVFGRERAARVEQAAPRPVEHTRDDTRDGRQQASRGALRQGREQGRHVQTIFWNRMAEDGLLDPAIDLTWLIDTSRPMPARRTPSASRKTSVPCRLIVSAAQRLMKAVDR